MANICDNLLIAFGDRERVTSWLARARSIGEMTNAPASVKHMFDEQLTVAMLRFDSNWDPPEEHLATLDRDFNDVQMLLLWNEPGMLGVGFSHVCEGELLTESLPLEPRESEPMCLPVVCVRTAFGDVRVVAEFACQPVFGAVSEPMPAAADSCGRKLPVAVRAAVADTMRDYPTLRYGVGVDIASVPGIAAATSLESVDGIKLADSIVIGGYGRAWDERELLEQCPWVRQVLIDHAERYTHAEHVHELLAVMLSSLFKIDVADAVPLCTVITPRDARHAAMLLDAFGEIVHDPGDLVAAVGAAFAPVT